MSLIVEQAIYEIKLLADNVPDGKHMDRDILKALRENKTRTKLWDNLPVRLAYDEN